MSDTRRPRIWMIEMWNADLRRWEPTKGIGLLREDARQMMAAWNEVREGDETYRVRAYVKADALV